MVDLFWSACVDDTDLRSREKQRERERETNKQGLRPYKPANSSHTDITTQRLFYPKKQDLCKFMNRLALSPNVIIENIWTTPAVTNLEISDLIGWGRSPRTSTRSVYTKVLGRPPWVKSSFPAGSEKNVLGGTANNNETTTEIWASIMFQKLELPDTFGYGMIHMWNTLPGSRLLIFSTFCQGNSGDDQVAGIWGCYTKSQVSTKTL